MARPVAGDFLRDATPIFSPVARPVDTYYQPGRPAQSSAEALTNALAGLDQTINPILQKKEDKAKERELAEGEILFKQNRKDFSEAVRTGAIPAGASPYVRKGYRQSQLHTLGANYATELARGLEESEIYKVDDPAQIEEYLSKFHNQFIQTNNLGGYDKVEIATILNPMITKANDSFRGRQVERNIQFIETERFTAFEGEVLATLDMQTFDGSRSQVNAAVGATSEWLKAKADELDAEGLDRTKISKTIIGIVTAAAEADNDLDILSVLDNVTLGTAPLSSTAYGRQQMTRAKESILSAGLRAQAAAAQANAKARQAAIEQASLDATNAAIAGDDAAYQEAFRRLGQMDASEARSVYNFKEARDEGRTQKAQQGAWGSFDAALSKADTREDARAVVAEYTANGMIPYSDAADSMRTWDRLHGESSTPEEQRFFTFGPANDVISDLEKSIVGNEFDSNVTKRDRAALMKNDWRETAIDWYDKNKREDGTFDRTAFLQFAIQFSRQRREIYLTEEVSNDDALEVNAPFVNSPPPPPAWAQ